MALVFERLLGRDDKPSVSFSQGMVDLLESVTPADKAMAVPFLRIWQVDANTGQPVHQKQGDTSQPIAPLNLQFSAPPSFGSSLGQFRERPPVSLERVAIKTAAPRGMITWQQIDMSFMVHRPDVIFGDPDPDVDNWSSIITPGAVHAMEYGWSASPGGVRNGILNGEGYSDLETKPPTVIPGRKIVRFVVTNYTFRILPDNQVSVQVTAYEEGEFNLRRAVLGAHMVRTEEAPEKNAVAKRTPEDLYSETGRKIVGALQAKIKKLSGGKVAKNDTLITFKRFADEILAPTIETALNEIGFSDVKLLMGDFNTRVGKPSKKYRLMESGGSSFIGDFEIPLKEIEKIFNTQMKAGGQITLYNFVSQFLGVFRSPDTWDRKNVDKNKLSCIPDVRVRTTMNPAKRAAVFMIVDVNREFTKFTDGERKPELARTREDVKKVLRDKGVPVISLLKGNSYIQDASFEVQSDDQIKSIFMRRALDPIRAGVVDSGAKQKVAALVDPREVLYSSAITGDVTMLGSFAFDLFGLIWLDFGIPRWDGPFVIKEREDVVDRQGFTVKISLTAEGSDPLGTQGRLKDLSKVT